MPALQPIIAKHWKSMVIQDKHLETFFSETPLTAFKKEKNLRDLLIKSKVAPSLKKIPGKTNERDDKMLKVLNCMCLHFTNKRG